MRHSHLSGDLYYVECCDLKKRSAVILCSTTQLAGATMVRYLKENTLVFSAELKECSSTPGQCSICLKSLTFPSQVAKVLFSKSTGEKEITQAAPPY